MKMIKRIAIIVTMLTLAIGLLYSAQVDSDKKKAEFLSVFDAFIENIYSDSLSTFCASSDVDYAKAMQHQLSTISKHIQYMPALTKIGSKLLVETDRDLYDDLYPYQYITYTLAYVKDFRELNPEAFAILSDDDFCLFIQEEYGTSTHNKTVICQSAIVFSQENYKVLSAPIVLDKRKAIS